MVVMALLEEGLVVLMIQVPMVVVQGEMALVLWVMQQQVIMEELVEWRLVVMPLLVEEVQAILMEQLVVVVALDMSLDLEEGEELMAQMVYQVTEHQEELGEVLVTMMLVGQALAV